MRILQVLYYYEPYTSGLTIYAARLACEMTARGHHVQVICSRHESSLPKHEITADGIEIIRLPVLANVDRAVLLPTLIPVVLSRLKDVDVVHLHLPMVETALLVALCRAFRKRVVVTHHADLVLNGSVFTKLAASVDRFSSIIGGRFANAFVSNTASRAEVSPIGRFMRHNLQVIPPPLPLHPLPPDADTLFRDQRGWGERPVIGFVGRYASEKGIEVLLQTIPLIRMRYPDALLALAGPHTDPRTGQRREGPWTVWLDRYGYAVEELGSIYGDDLASFYAAMDVLVLPSVDWTESFGMVQVEAMQQGTPVVASNLPGVCEPIANTGGGLLVKPGDVNALATAITEVLSQPRRYVSDPGRLDEHYSLDTVVTAWERVYEGSA